MIYLITFNIKSQKTGTKWLCRYVSQKRKANSPGVEGEKYGLPGTN